MADLANDYADKEAIIEREVHIRFEEPSPPYALLRVEAARVVYLKVNSPSSHLARLVYGATSHTKLHIQNIARRISRT